MKKTALLAAGFICLSTIISCKKEKTNDMVQINAATEIARMQTEIEKLIRENENLKSTTITESKLCGKIEYNYTIKDYELAKAYIISFMDLFPRSDRIKQFRTYYDNILAEEEEQNAILREQQISEYQNAMADYTGIWAIKNFTDQDGNIIEKTFVTTAEPLTGTYSDVSYEAANFEATLIITAKNNISMMIYENDQVVSGSKKSPIKYNITITDSKGTSFSFAARNTSDRIQFSTSSSSKLHSALLLGGNIKFELSTTRDSYPVKYELEIPNAQFYNTVCRLMGIL